MCPNGRNKGPTVVVVVVNESSKSHLFDGGGQSMDINDVGGNELAIEEPHCCGPLH